MLTTLIAAGLLGSGDTPAPSDLLAEFRIRYPEFAAVPDATVEYWLDDALLIVTDSWIEADRKPAQMALAAHNLARRGLAAGGSGIGGIAAKGVTSFKSASFSVNFDASAAKAAAAGGYGSTMYGQDFQIYLHRNRGGPFLAGCAHVC
jgi:hypothetical protein